VTTNSLSRRPEKTHEIGGVPLRAITRNTPGRPKWFLAPWGENDAQRRLRGGLILSLALHALVLGMLAPLISDGSMGVTPAEALHAMLRPASEAISTAAVPSEPTLHKPPRRPAVSALVERSTPAVLPAPTLVETTVPAVAGGESTQRATLTPATVALATPVETRGPDAAGLRQYRLALAGEARRFRRYPDTARREGITGTAEVRVTVAATGMARQAELARSSGHAALDAAALEMLRQAAARALLPESLRGQDFVVLLPVVFAVDE